jgi:hypothetical protein
MFTASMPPTTGDVCRECRKPVSQRAKFRLCGRCQRLRTCPVCRRLGEQRLSGRWCDECSTMYHTCNVVRALDVTRPDPATLRERLMVYQARASRELPLFDPPA